MGQQQLLLIILGVIIVGIAIAVGLNMMTQQNVDANRQALITDMNAIAARAALFWKTPAQLGGGGFAFTGFVIPGRMQSNSNGSYAAVIAGNTITITGTSSQAAGNTVTATFDQNGALSGTYTFAGEFDY